MTIQRIAEIVAAHFGLPVAQLQSRRRPEFLVWPRHIAMTIATERGHNNSDVAAWFKKDRGTVTNALRHVNDRVQTYKRDRNTVDDIRGSIKN
jgi:chromosomal replication initiation ATPase DnaA